MSIEAEVVAMREAKEVDRIIMAEVATTQKETSAVEVAIPDNMMEKKTKVAKINTSKTITEEVEVEAVAVEVATIKTMSRWTAKSRKVNGLATITIREIITMDNPKRLVEALILSSGIEYPVDRKTQTTIFRSYRRKVSRTIKNILTATILKKDINIHTGVVEEDTIRKEVENIVEGATGVAEEEVEALTNLERAKKVQTSKQSTINRIRQRLSKIIKIFQLIKSISTKRLVPEARSVKMKRLKLTSDFHT